MNNTKDKMPNKQKPPIKELKIAFIDTETTGLDHEKHEIIEIAAVIYDPINDKIIKEWSRKAAPRHIETAENVALEMNGYKEAPQTYTDDIKDVMIEFSEITHNCIMAGQNLEGFDVKFISKYYEEFEIPKGFHRHRKLELSSFVWPIVYKSELRSLSLAKICEFFDISNDGEHRALVDCKRTLEVYRCMMKTWALNS